MSDDAIPAATLVVMRDVAGSPPELLMVTRAQRMAFASGAMVFPGGRIDPADRALGGDALGAARVAAVRETLEETGVPAGLTGETPAGLQDRLHSGEPFADLLKAHSLEIDHDALVPFARWKPTFKHTRRFDTLFLLARAPERDWPLRPQAGECDSAEWLSATEVLRRVGAGEASAIFPTMRNLERLATLGSFDEAIAHAMAHPVETISPWIELVDGKEWLRIPDHLGYPVTGELLTDANRA